MADLNNKELRIIRLVSEGFTTKEIANILGFKEATTDTYRFKINRKLGAKSSSHCMAICFRNGIL